MTEHEWLVCEDPQRMLRLRRTECCGSFWIAHEDGSVSVSADSRPCAQCDNGPVEPQPIFGDRQLRLFACACVRQVWHLLTDDAPCPYCKDADFSTGDLGSPMFGGQEPYASRARAYYRSKCACGGTGRINRSRRAVEVAERYADGKATSEERGLAFNSADLIPYGCGPDPGFVQERSRVCACLRANAGQGAMEAVSILTLQGRERSAAEAALLREIVGNPFRPVTVSRNGRTPTEVKELQRSMHGCCSRNADNMACDCLEEAGDVSAECLTPAIIRMARAIYEDRDWGALPILADYLEDAGYPDGDLLRHLRGEERCWCFGLWKSVPKYAECRHCGGARWMHLRGPHVRGCWALDYVRGVK